MYHRIAVISQDIIERRDEYLAIMHQHGTMSPAAIIESVREMQAELLDIFCSVPDDVASRKPAPDEWNLHELATHAWFTERLLAKIVHHVSRGEIPSAEDLEGAGIGMMPQEEARSYRQVIDALDQTNSDMIAAVQALPDAPNLELQLPHPFFGPLTCLEWAGFQRVHDLDHIQHARKILTAVSP